MGVALGISTQGAVTFVVRFLFVIMFVENIQKFVLEFDSRVLGIHDLIVHNYGPGCIIASIHVEVDGSANVFDTHDAIDRMEKQLFDELNIHATAHMDPIVTDDPVVDELRQRVAAIVCELDGALTIHDFRMVRGPTHTNLIFDVVVPFELGMSEKVLRETIAARVRSIDENLCTVITVDRA